MNTPTIIIVGASSGLGQRLTDDFASQGWRVGVAARREEELRKLKDRYPTQVEYRRIDVTDANAANQLYELINTMGGMDVMFLASGIGKQNTTLDIDVEVKTVETNAVGFTRIVDAAYRYFRENPSRQPGQIAVISSVAGTKGMGAAASYSATKRFQYTYITALEQLAGIEKVKIDFTDIRPGFIRTPLLSDDGKYPMIMTIDYAAPRIMRAILKRKRIAYIDWRWHIAVALWRLIPRFIWKRLPIY